MRFIGIDPGERWVGIAMLEATGSKWQAESRVLDVQARSGFLQLVSDVLIWAPATIIAEDYRVRPVGHQAFTAGYTLRLLGALQVSAEAKDATWIMLQPGPAAELDLLQLGRFVKRSDWPASNDPHWQHALSAWRVLGRYLLQEHKELLEKLRKTKKPKVELKKDLMVPRTIRSTYDRHSPLTQWRTDEGKALRKAALPRRDHAEGGSVRHLRDADHRHPPRAK